MMTIAQVHNKIAGFITKNNLLDEKELYLVALSGGADSTALLLILKHLGYRIQAVHCNFKLRGEESDRDEQFCVDLCEQEGIELHRVHFDTRFYARTHKVSIEMAARELRYSYFRQLARDINAKGICVAHHSDDSVETLLMNLVRGTGIHGLSGISAKNNDVVRPLLCISRKDVEYYLDLRKQSYITDSTNLVNDVLRNKIRLDIIPMLQKLNPSVSANIARTAERIAEAVKMFDDSLKRSVGNVVKSEGDVLSVDIETLKMQPSPEYVLYGILKEKSFSPSEIENIYANINAEPGRVYKSGTHQLVIDRDMLIVEPLCGEELREIRIPEEGTYVYDGGKKFKIERFHREKGFVVSREKNVCTLDAKSVKFPITVRKVKAGDRFVPFGMKGSKLVSDYMTDRKMSLFDKRRQLLLEDAEGRVLWLAGERPDNRFRVTDKTEDVMVIYLKTN